MSGLYERLRGKEKTTASEAREGSAVKPSGAASATQRTAAIRVYTPSGRTWDGAARERLRSLRDRAQQRLLQHGGDGAWADPARRREARNALVALLREEGVSPLEQDEYLQALEADLLGFGPLQPLLDDDQVSEIMVNAPDQVYVERFGRLEKAAVTFADEAEVMKLVERIVSPLGRRVDEASPMVDARLPDGSRVNVIVPPLALRGATVTIRKFARDPLTVEDLIRFGTLTQSMADLLNACVRARLNVLVSGSTASGKTTTLNVLSSFIPPDERIVTIEDAAELQLRQEHVVSLETRPANVEGRGEVSIRHLVRNALRMRPDRIVVGEVRGGEALDMLQAMNTGHDGSLTTVHANGPRDALSRLETMVLMAGLELPIKAIREQIASALDLIIHQQRLRDGSRRITHVTEVQGLEGDVIVMQDIFQFQQQGVGEDGRVLGQFKASGVRPRFSEKLQGLGIDLPPDLFG